MSANGVNMRNPHCEQMFSAFLPTTDVIRQRSSWATSITARAVGHRTCGTAATFDEARAHFEAAAWRVFLSNRTEVDFQEWRDQRDWTARKYAMWEARERLPSAVPQGGAEGEVLSPTQPFPTHVPDLMPERFTLWVHDYLGRGARVDAAE
jgi:hypothetical protein